MQSLSLQSGSFTDCTDLLFPGLCCASRAGQHDKKKKYDNKIKKVLNTGPQAHVFFLHPLKSFSFKGKSQAWYSQCRPLLGASPAWQLLPEPSEEGSLKPRFSENAQISAEVHKNLPELSV